MITMLEEMYENFLNDVEEMLDPARSNRAVFARVQQKIIEIRQFRADIKVLILKEIENMRCE